MFRAFWTIAAVLMCCGGVTGYSLLRVANLADAADDQTVMVKDACADDDRAA